MLVYMVLQSSVRMLDPNVVEAHFLFYDTNHRCIEDQVRRFVAENCRRKADQILNQARRDAITDPRLSPPTDAEFEQVVIREESRPLVMTEYDYKIVELRWT